ncbi:hypothetical protein [Halostagnicola kamekurae]|uniref:Uncharacterized protein n=1 Tax=Halostagnicola kamekurae TaxID=619731 RepID=A0A1I6TLW5_9EURY|nr:hypothetical protein [Halostagnicola kamekurae]SFS90110.1 hypothetical protein SAMN04488556_3214 [Halostagnicola kamekurae]
MNRPSVFYGFSAILGIAIGVDGFISGTTDGFGIFVMLVCGGGALLVITSLYKTFSTDPSEFQVPFYAILVMGLCALMALLSVVLQVAG